MRLLLDSQLLFWSLMRPSRLGRRARDLIVDDRNEKLFSAASIWEISIKAALRRGDFEIEPRQLLAAARVDYVEAVVTSSAALGVAGLPLHHRDPFDRLLVAQAIELDAVLLSADRALAAYGSQVLVAT